MTAVNIGMPRSISHSRVDSFLTCRRKDYYSYVLRLTKKDGSAALGFGTASHRVLDVLYTYVLQSKTTAGQRRLLPKAIQAARDEIARIEAEGFEGRDDRIGLRALFEDWYFPNEPFVRKGFLVLGSEVAHNLKLTDDVSYTFIVDLVVKTPAGDIVVVDHKNQYDFLTEAEAKLLPQIPKYVGALRALGTDVAYGMYNQLRTRKLSGPAMKKDEIIAALAKVKLKRDDGTFWPVVELKKLTVPVLTELAESKGIVTKVGPQLEQMLTQTEVRPSDKRVIRTFDDQLDIAIFLVERDSEDSVEEIEEAAWRVGNKGVCNYCDFRTLCAAELQDEGVEDVMAFYEEREAREGVPLTEDDLEG